MVGIFDTFTFGFAHEIKVDGLASDNGAEGAIFHDDHAIAQLGDEEGGLGGLRMVGRSLSGGLLHGAGDNLVVDDRSAGNRGRVGQRLAGIDTGGAGCVWLLWIHWVISPV